MQFLLIRRHERKQSSLVRPWRESPILSRVESGHCLPTSQILAVMSLVVVADR